MKNWAAGSFAAVTVSAAAAWLLLGAASVHAAPLPPASAGVRTSTEHGIEFVTVGDAGNAAYPGGPAIIDRPRKGRGSVNYEYRIGRTEVTTSQYLEFLNTMDALDPTLADRVLDPLEWGAGYVIGQPPGQRYRQGTGAHAGDLPVGGMRWRAAAMFCNWLHNDKAPTLEAIMSGAYDVSTFTRNPDGTYNDQLTRSPGARFWIPSLDEWMKASFYAPDASQPGQGTWWEYPYDPTLPPVTGLPGEAGAQTGADLPGGSDDYFRVPLKSYPQAMTPWGLLDVSGGASEWVEEGGGYDGLRDRVLLGSFTGLALGAAEYYDVPWQALGSFGPEARFPLAGVRVAAAIPCPPCAALLVGVVFFIGPRRPLSLGSSSGRPS